MIRIRVSVRVESVYKVGFSYCLTESAPNNLHVSPGLGLGSVLGLKIGFRVRVRTR